MRATDGSAWIVRRRSRGRPAPRPGTSRPLPDRNQDELGKRRQPVDRTVRVADQRDLVDCPVDRSRPGLGERFVTARGHDLLEAASPRFAQIGDVGPLVLDVLAELLQAVERVEARSSVDRTVSGMATG